MLSTVRRLFCENDRLRSAFLKDAPLRKTLWGDFIPGNKIWLTHSNMPRTVDHWHYCLIRTILNWPKGITFFNYAFISDVLPNKIFGKKHAEMEKDIKYLKITKPYFFRFFSLCIFMTMNILLLNDQYYKIISSNFIYFISYIYIYYVSYTALISSFFLKYIHMEKFAGDCYFFAVYDGHGSSGKEAS